MIATNVTLTLLTEDDREQFILDNQYAFKFGAVEEFGMRDTTLTATARSSRARQSNTALTTASLTAFERRAKWSVGSC